jgi:preprotein translocase subunit SecG
MEDSFLFQNNFNENEKEDNNFNLNLSFQNDESSNYFPNILNQELNIDSYENNIVFNKNILSMEEENLNKEIPKQENILEPFNEKFEKDSSNLNISNSQLSQSNSTKGTGDKNNESKLNDIKINEIINDEKDKKKNNNINTGKKRKQRIHLEDLNIDPEIIKCKKYQTIGDKVITSKNSKITDLDRKEIRAIRNRISAQKSRDRKKAEFNELQKKVKFYEELTKKHILMIKDYERISCPECRAKFMELKLNISLDQNDPDKEILVLDEDISFFSSDKKGSILTKLTGALIAIVCLLGIILCLAQGNLGGNLIKNRNINDLNKLNEEYQLRHLSEEETFEEKNGDNNIELKEDNGKVLLPINQEILDYNINQLQLYHDRFGFEINSYLMKKNKERNGFLMKTQLYNQKNNSVCIETKNIEHNNYIIDQNSLKNTLPVEANNMLIDNNLSHKIISLFVKDYNTLSRYINGRSLTLQEQIEIEAKNSEDGCVYLQMIIPNYESGENNSTLNSEYKNSFFEIRCKIFAYNNYYESKLATTATTY